MITESLFEGIYEQIFPWDQLSAPDKVKKCSNIINSLFKALLSSDLNIFVQGSARFRTVKAQKRYKMGDFFPGVIFGPLDQL